MSVETKFTGRPENLITSSKPTVETEDVSTALPAPIKSNVEEENLSLASPGKPDVEIGAYANTLIPPSKPIIQVTPNEISPGSADLQIETSNKTDEQALETELVEESTTWEQMLIAADVLSSLSAAEHDLLVEPAALLDLTEEAVEKSSGSQPNHEMSEEISRQRNVEETPASSDMHSAVIDEANGFDAQQNSGAKISSSRNHRSRHQDGLIYTDKDC